MSPGFQRTANPPVIRSKNSDTKIENDGYPERYKGKNRKSGNALRNCDRKIMKTFSVASEASSGYVE